MKRKEDWNLPTQQELFRPILEVGARYPTGNHISVYYKECKEFFPHLKEDDFNGKTGAYTGNAWQIQIRYAKKKLEYDLKYMVANLARGFWQISNAGMKALEQMRAGTWERPKKGRKGVRQ